MQTIILNWVLPLVWGGAIGYLTNALAIRMLFRPLTRKHLFGIPVPLTPGIIPRRRGELARSIGRMVSRELLSAETLRERLESETFGRMLEAQFRTLREAFARKPLADLAAAVGGGRGGGEPAAGRTGAPIDWPHLVRRVLEQMLRRLVGSRAFIYGVRSLVERLVDDLGARRLRDLVTADQLTRLVAGGVLPALTGSAVRTQVAAAVRRWLRRRREQNTPLNRFLTPDTVDLLAELLQRNLPALLEALFTWLRGPDMRRQLEVRGRALLRDILDKLNVMQRMFVTVGQYDESLRERMPEIVADVIAQAEAATGTPAVQEQIVAAARSALNRWGERGVRELTGDTAEQLDALVDHLVRRVFDALAGDGPGSGQSPVVRAVEGWYRKQEHASVAELAARHLGVQPAAVADALSNLLLAALARPETAGRLAEQIPAMVSGALGDAADAGSATVQDVVSVAPDTAQELDRFLARRSVAFLSDRLPSLLATVDVEAMVVARIDSLDPRSVEQLLLTVMERHLKWVKLFGAVIGAAIGVLMIVLQAVGPAAV
ncbi:MAG: DUF445 family protein [Spirochaetaceae bacterium]|nr:DUF445 family protein [Spirochaetaceae bacterium]